MAGGRPAPGWWWAGWLALVAVAAFPLAEALRILIQGSQPVLYGDQALLDLGARRAVQLDQLVGPYSREGFHHPGPAVFYLLAPFVGLFGAGGQGLYLGAVAINAGALIATVGVVWHRCGALAALWAAAALDLYCLCAGVGTFREPWNPYLVVAPMVLFVVLWSAAIAGSRAAVVWALVVGSYLVQTHIATAGFVLPMCAVGLVALVVSGRRGSGSRLAARRGWGLAVGAGATALGVIWLAPVIELWRDRPNNVQLMWRFFASSHPAAPASQAVKLTAAALTIVPFGNRDYVLSFSRGWPEAAAGAALIVGGAAAAVALGLRRRQPMTLALAVSSLMGVVLGAGSLLLTAAPLYPWFAVWLGYVPVVLLVAIGIGLLTPVDGRPGHRWPEHPRWGRWYDWRAGPRAASICVVAVVALAGLTVGSDLRQRPISATTGSGPWPGADAATAGGRAQTVTDTAVLSKAAERVLGPQDRWVGFTIGTSSSWPYVAGIILALDEEGVQSTVSPASWTLYFGPERAPGRVVAGTFELAAASDPAARSPAGGAVIAEIDGQILSYRAASG